MFLVVVGSTEAAPPSAINAATDEGGRWCRTGAGIAGRKVNAAALWRA
jgi:hypothetical protein